MSKDIGTILVSGASGIVGYGILRSLKETGYRLIGTTIYDVSPAECFADIVEKPPMTVDEAYIPWLLNVIKTYKVDMIIPGIEADMSSWNKNRVLLENTMCYVLLNNPQLIELCLDKWLFFEKLKDYKLPYAIDSTLEQDYNRFKKPFIIKPRCGFGARGIVKVSDRQEFEENKHLIGTTHMAQELVGDDGAEYTVSAFFDVHHNLKAMIQMRRYLSKFGYTEYAEVVDEKELREAVEKISEVMKPIGPTNFQFRNHKGDWKLLEINPRISSSTSIRTKFGYNEGKMSVEYFLRNKEITQPLISSGRAMRYIEDMVL